MFGNILIILLLISIALLIIGLVDPRYLASTLRSSNRGHVLKVFGTTAALLLIFLILSTANLSDISIDLTSSNEEATERLDALEDGIYSVSRVIDGDTIAVDTGSGEEVIRFIGIDAAELSRGGAGEDECYAKEASDRMDELVGDQEVLLVADETQDDRDVYGRSLRYVELDGIDIGARLIAEGYVREFTFIHPYSRQSDYLIAQEKAEKEALGLWSKCLI